MKKPANFAGHRLLLKSLVQTSHLPTKSITKGAVHLSELASWANQFENEISFFQMLFRI